MKINQYSFSKTIQTFAISSLWILIATHCAFGVDKASKSDGGSRLVLNNKTKYELLVSDVVFTSEWGGERNVDPKILGANSSITIDPGQKCPYWLKSDLNHNPCFFGNKKFRSYYFTITGSKFDDSKEIHKVDISKPNGYITVQDKESREEKGCCTYMKIRWDAAWKSDHWEITFEEKPTGTSLLRENCLVDCD